MRDLRAVGLTYLDTVATASDRAIPPDLFDQICRLGAATTA
jgi:hypothetical protein